MYGLVVRQYVELYPTIPSETGGSIESGTRGIVEAVHRARPDGGRTSWRS